MKQRVISAIKVLFWVYVLTLVIITFMPSAGIQEIIVLDKEWRVDYPIHALAFLVLPIMAYMASQNGDWRKRWRLLVLLSLFLAITTELLQLISGRVFNVWDIVSNLTGVFLGIFIVVLTNNYLEKKLVNRRLSKIQQN